MPDNDGDAVVQRLVEAFDDLVPALTGLGPDDALGVITRRAVDTIPGATAASVSRAVSPGGFESVGVTDELARQVDAIQYELNSGPCVDAAVTDSVFLTGDLRNDRRWPQFGARATTETDVRSMLAFRMFIEDDDYVAALNVFSTDLDAFRDEDRLAGLVLATWGALAITSARRLDRIVNLERALESNRDIGVAIGVLMGLHRVTRDQAFDLLRMASQARHRKLADVARGVAETGSLDPL